MSDHKHEPSTFWYPCFLCEKATYARQLREKAEREPQRDEPSHSPTPDGPWWFPTADDRDDLRGDW